MSTQAKNERKKGKLDSLQAYRGFAALAVVLLHLTSQAYDKYVPGYVFCNGYFRQGGSGVDFFFVLSGFIIYYTQSRMFGNPEGMKTFIKNRFTRIFPVYWIVTVLYLLGFSATLHNLDYSFIIQSFLLIPQHIEPVVRTGWSLSYEILFYAVFAWLIQVRSRLSWIPLAPWFILSGASAFHVVEFKDSLPLQFLFSGFHVDFLLGCITAHIAIRHAVQHRKAILLVGSSLFCLPWILQVNVFDFRIYYGLAASLIICGASQIDLHDDIHVPRILVFLGDASYSIYLIHTAVISALFMALNRLHLTQTLGNGISVCMVGIGATVIGSLFHYFVERPVLNFSRKF